MSILGFFIMAAAVEEAKYDHTHDIAAVAHLLAEVRAGKSKDDSVSVINRDEPTNSNFTAFASYANACNIDKIYAIPSATKPLPISVTWDCGQFEEVDGKPVWKEHSAGFWVVNRRVVRIAFGQAPTLKIPVSKLRRND